MKAATRLVAVVLAVVGGTARAADAVVATAAWARATPPGLATGAGYVMLAGGIHPDRLVAAHLDGVARIEFHESSLDGGVARMRQLPSVAIPPRTTVAFSPAGLHLMLIGLREPLREDATFPMTLEFERAGKVEVKVVVGQPKPAAAGSGHMH